MTIIDTAKSLFRPILSLILGLCMSALGVLRSITSYPGHDAFTRFAAAWPTVTAVAGFVLAIASALAGLLLLLPAILRLRRRHQQLRALQRHDSYGVRVPPLNPPRVHPDDYFGAEPDGYDPNDPSGSDDLFGANGGYLDDHRGDQRGDYGGREHSNGEYERRLRSQR